MQYSGNIEKMMKERIVVICIGFLLDRIFGDPHNIWHPVQGIGKLISLTERFLRKIFGLSMEREMDKGKKRIAGGILVVFVIAVVMGIVGGILFISGKYCPWLKYGIETILCYQMLALKSLKTESMKVYDCLTKEGTNQDKLERGRKAVAMIVGRDTEHLSQEQVVKATVETIAENTSDGVIAPLFYMCLFGPLGALFYKTVNTMDSMIAYKNDRYCYFGTVAAKLDDILNWIPARLSALFMLIACGVAGYDKENAWNIFKRDRYQHASPNSAQTESVCAGALGLRLAGPTAYFGVMYQKPYIGDAKRTAETEDIRRANHLLEITANLFFVFCIVILMIVYIKLPM